MVHRPFRPLRPTLALPLAVAAQTQSAGPTSFPVTGTGTAPSGPVDFQGNFVVEQFHVTDGQLFAQGHLTGTLTETATGTKTPVPDTAVDLPVTSANGKALPSAGAASSPAAEDFDMQIAQVGPSCSILHLVLGPLHLNLLGLVVDLNQVLLDITGQTGAGNIVGNLLCAITGLLDAQGTLTIIANLLNAILDVLRMGLG